MSDVDITKTKLELVITVYFQTNYTKWKLKYNTEGQPGLAYGSCIVTLNTSIENFYKDLNSLSDKLSHLNNDIDYKTQLLNDDGMKDIKKFLTPGFNINGTQITVKDIPIVLSESINFEYTIIQNQYLLIRSMSKTNFKCVSEYFSHRIFKQNRLVLLSSKTVALEPTGDYLYRAHMRLQGSFACVDWCKSRTKITLIHVKKIGPVYTNNVVMFAMMLAADPHNYIARFTNINFDTFSFDIECPNDYDLIFFTEKPYKSGVYVDKCIDMSCASKCSIIVKASTIKHSVCLTKPYTPSITYINNKRKTWDSVSKMGKTFINTTNKILDVNTYYYDE